MKYFRRLCIPIQYVNHEVIDNQKSKWLFFPSLFPGRPESPVSSKVVTISHLVDVIVRNSLTFNSPRPYIGAQSLSDLLLFFF